MAMSTGIVIVVAVVAIAVGILAGYLIRKTVGEKAIGSAEQKAKNLILDAEHESETVKKEKLLEAKEEALKLKNEAEKEIRERRNEISKAENRLVQKEETIDRKLENIERKEQSITDKEEDLNKKKKETVIVDTDEGPRPGTTVEVLGKLRPAFKKDGMVTAGNSSGINDGAAAVVVMSEEKAKELGVKPMATWVAGALAGVEPRIMGIGPVAATRKVLEKTGMSIGDFDIIEANEAFAAQSVAVGKELGFDLSKLNPNGGAIALGHPVGASGCRILVTLLHEMEKKDAKTGLATLCIGGGMGCAAVVKRD